MNLTTAIVTMVFVASLGFSSCAQEGQAKVEEVAINVPTASCEMCAETITKAVKAVDGVKGATVDLEKKIVHVKYVATMAKQADLELAVAKSGYDANSTKRDSEAYESLPACCK